MDRARLNDQLGVNKIGKNIKKSPLHQPNLANGIEISKNGFTSFVQKRTSSPLPPPPQNTRLQKIRPAVLTPMINRPHVPPPPMAQPTHNLARPPMMGHGDSPLSVVYMRYLQSSLGDSGHHGDQMKPQPQVQVHAQPQPPPQSHDHHSPRFNGSAARDQPLLPTPTFNGLQQQQMYNESLPSPRFNGRGILPSPTSQYRLQSPYPLLSPGVHKPPPLTPRSFTSSSVDQPGILGPGTFPPASSGLVSPSSAYGFSPISSPRWRD